MNFSLLSIRESAILLACMQIAFVLVTLNLDFNLTKYRHKLRLFFSLIIFILTIINLGTLMELNRLHYNELVLVQTSIIINKIPHCLQYIYAIFIASFSIFNIYKLIHISKGEISNNTVKEAIENLPCGLAFYDRSGYIYLSNKVIQNLSLELTSKDLQNGNELWDDIINLKNNNDKINENEYIVITENKIVWKIFKDSINIDGMIYKKIQADDISDVYNLSIELKNKNKCLKNDQKKLIEHMENIDKYISEEESLRVKMMVHDKFGELITLTNKMYKENLENKDKKFLIENWDILNRKMEHLLVFENSEEYSLEKVLYFAKRLDCKINLIGKLPNDVTNRKIIIYALNEMMKNAVNHVNAKTINIKIEEEKEEEKEKQKITIIIQNENKNKIDKIIEGGGLSSVRNKIEKVNGIMEIICDENIILKIILNKNMEEKNV